MPNLKQKGFGFYAVTIAAILSFISAFVYRISYQTAVNPYYTDSVFFAMLAVLPVVAILVFLKLDDFAPAIATCFIGYGILQFIYSMYFDISVVLVGIDKTRFDPEFVLSTILLLICFIISEVSIYAKVNKKAS